MAILDLEYLEEDLSACNLCEWHCSVDRLNGETGLCGNTIPLVASSMLHPAPPASFDAFLTGCNFKCLYCQNWPISMFHSNKDKKPITIEGYYDPETWAELGVVALCTEQARSIKADRLFFTGGEPTCSLPWVESVVDFAKKLKPDLKINFDTNGYFTEKSLKRVLNFSDSITYDLKAFDTNLFRILTGASNKPVLRNLNYIINNSPEKIWEVRVTVIPKLHEKDIIGICKYLADIDNTVPLNFLAFRPNFIMDKYFGATSDLLKYCSQIAKEYGLANVSCSGHTGISGNIPKSIQKKMKELTLPESLALPTAFAQNGGCVDIDRNCGICKEKLDCPLKKYRPTRME